MDWTLLPSGEDFWPPIRMDDGTIRKGPRAEAVSKEACAMSDGKRVDAGRIDSGGQFDGYLVTSENFEPIFVPRANQLVHLHNNMMQAYSLDLENIIVHRVRVTITEHGAR